MRHVSDPTTRAPTVRTNVLTPAFLFATTVLIASFTIVHSPVIGTYGWLLLAYLSVRVSLSLVAARPSYASMRTYLPTVGVCVTSYNEDPDTLARCLTSIENQTYRPSVVVLVDDASTDWDEYSSIFGVWTDWLNLNPINRFIMNPVNSGKRHAMARAFAEMPDVEIFVCVDSDTILAPGAIQKGILKLADPRVMAATGTVIASNYRKNLLTRMIDLRYVNAFLCERSAYSQLGSVLCVCGSLAFWRASVVREVQHDFLNQIFLGKLQTAGDDRHMTNQLLKFGKVVHARNSIAQTAVPEKVSHYLRQQARWGRSFWRESFWTLTHHKILSVPFWLAMTELITNSLFSAGLLVALVVDPIVTGQWHLVSYLIWIVLASWARSVHAGTINRGYARWREVLVAVMVAPVYGFMNLALLPVRLFSLATLTSNKWGTRKKIEISTVIQPA